MAQEREISILVGKKKMTIPVSSVLYVEMSRDVAQIHVAGGAVYRTRITLADLEEMLGEGFLKTDRGCLVSAMAIHDVGNTIELVNGESLSYVVRRKKQIKAKLAQMQRGIIDDFSDNDTPRSPEEYRSHYRCFDTMPIAFTDIEMVWGEENNAVDWIFRYGNEALAKLEKMPLERLIGSSFGSLFANMDSKWLRSYERAALYGETLEIIDYSPEIDTYLNVICFPTFQGHCGCILFDVADLKFAQEITDSQRAMGMYLQKFLAFRPV